MNKCTKNGKDNLFYNLIDEQNGVNTKCSYVTGRHQKAPRQRRWFVSILSYKQPITCIVKAKTV